MVGIGLLGYGYWGPNLARNIAENPAVELRAGCDLDSVRRAAMGSLYPSARVCQQPQEVIDDPTVDAVVIATPLHSHYDLSMAALRAGKHVLVEKPMAATSKQAREMIDEADKRQLVLLVDHTFVYTGAVRKIREIISGGSFGDIYYYDSTRVNLGLFRRDVNVLWDLAVHDLSIMDYLMGKSPSVISATAHSHFPSQLENIAFLTIGFADNLIAHINVNWLSPVKIRRTLVGGSGQMIVYDDLAKSEKVKVYDHGVDTAESSEDIRDMLISYRKGNMWSPKIDSTEALRKVLDHFLACIHGAEKPHTDGAAGLAVIQLLEAADRSLRRGGAPEPIQSPNPG